MKNTTPVPNEVFEHIPLLSEAELKLYLIILRQTLGWRTTENLKRKVYDWISGSQFKHKTGLSRRAIVSAIRTLSFRNLILIADDHGRVLHTPQERRGKTRLYYRIAVDSSVHNPVEHQHPCAESAHDLRTSCALLAQRMRITKETPTK